MIIPAPNDIAFSLFGMPIYWYGITLALAMFSALLVANFLFNKKFAEYKKDIIIEFAPIIIICGILGARLYFCTLNPHFYLTHPAEILDIREGGLSIHGGIMGGILSLLFIVKKYKIPFLNIIDPVSCSTTLGQAIGRWGNYFNSEAYGLPTQSQNWGLYIPLQNRIAGYNQYALFHPTFLYESVLDFLAFIVLLLIYKKFAKEIKGITFYSYLIIYALVRFFIEGLRIDSALNIADQFPIAKAVSVLMLTIGLLGLVFCIKQYKSQKK